jgi:hypothetical protein
MLHLPFRSFDADPVMSDIDAYDDGEIRAGWDAGGLEQMSTFKGGATATYELDVSTKGFGKLLGQTLGGVATVGPTDANYEHTFSTDVTALNSNDALTFEANSPFHPSGTAQGVSYHGGKIVEAEFSIETGGVLTASFGLDFEDWTLVTPVALAFPTIASGGAKFPWSLAQVTIGGSAVEAKKWMVKIEKTIQTEERFLRNSDLKKEPIVTGYTISGEVEVNWVDITQYNRAVSTTLATRAPAIVMTVTGPVALAGTTVPRLVFTCPNAWLTGRLVPPVQGRDGLVQTLSFTAKRDASNDALSIAYRTNDTTP